MIESIKKFLPQTFNDFLAVTLILLIVVIWVIQGLGKLSMPAEVTGALIVTWTLIIQFYYRKKNEEN